MDFGHSASDLDVGFEVLEELGDFDSIETEELIYPDSGGKLDLDFVGYSQENAFLLELKNSLNKLFTGFQVMETGIENLRDQGYQVQCGMLVLDDELLKLREKLNSLPNVYDRDRLYNEWPEENVSINSLIESGICHDIDNLVEECRQPSTIPKYDWELLEQMEWVEETNEAYRATETLEKRLKNHGGILHTTDRAEYLIHPTDYI